MEIFELSSNEEICFRDAIKAIYMWFSKHFLLFEFRQHCGKWNLVNVTWSWTNSNNKTEILPALTQKHNKSTSFLNIVENGYIAYWKQNLRIYGRKMTHSQTAEQVTSYVPNVMSVMWHDRRGTQNAFVIALYRVEVGDAFKWRCPEPGPKLSLWPCLQ